jgi:hypothetical protein
VGFGDKNFFTAEEVFCAFAEKKEWEIVNASWNLDGVQTEPPLGLELERSHRCVVRHRER